MSYPERQFVSTKELAKHLGITPMAVLKRIQKGAIKAVKIGRSYAIPAALIREDTSAYPVITPQEGAFVSVMQAARMLGVTRATINNRINRGQIKARRSGRHYIIAREDIDVHLPRKKQEDVKLTSAYYSVPELARQLGVSRIAIFKRIRNGYIKANKVGRRYLIDRKEIDEKSSIDTPAKDHLSVPEAARILGISRIAVFKQVRRGTIKAVKIGRCYAIPKSEFSHLREGSL